jgi:predicted ATP-grasp superfamily ATP-dependent carboligase
MRVLVTDGHFRKTLAVVRSLGRKGVEVTVGERTFLNTAFFSKYCSGRILYPSPRRHPGPFIDFLLRDIKKNRYACLFPMEEETLRLVSKYRSEISRHTYLLVPEFEKIEFVRDKGNLVRFAEAHGIPVPRTFYSPPAPSMPRSAGLRTGLTPPHQGGGKKGGLPEVALPLDGGGEGGSVNFSDISVPAVIKPRISSGSFGIVYVQKKEDLAASYQSVHDRYPFPLIQEYIPDGGGTFGLSALFDEQSHVKAAFVHKKLRMYPIQGGPSTLREGVDHPGVMELGLSLLKALNWVGIAMVEFKVDPRDGVPKLMEVNPRFWGSLQLAIFSGVDFPYLILKMAKGERFEPLLHYETGKRCRWLLFGDILHFVNNPGRLHLRPSFFRFFEPNTCDDILSREDPLPLLGAAATFFTFLYDPEMKRFLERRL